MIFSLMLPTLSQYLLNFFNNSLLVYLNLLTRSFDKTRCIMAELFIISVSYKRFSIRFFFFYPRQTLKILLFYWCLHYLCLLNSCIILRNFLAKEDCVVLLFVKYFCLFIIYLTSKGTFFLMS